MSEVSITSKEGSVAVVDSEIEFYIRINLRNLERALGRKLKDNDVVEATVNGQTFKSTVSRFRNRSRLGVVIGANGRRVEHGILFE